MLMKQLVVKNSIQAFQNIQNDDILWAFLWNNLFPNIYIYIFLILGFL